MPLICQIYRIEKLTKLPRVIVAGSESLQVSNEKEKFKIERPPWKTTEILVGGIFLHIDQ